jgi:XXXCH domain-containing protein
MGYPDQKATPGIESRVRYSSLKKKMKSSFNDIGVSLGNQKLPEPEVINAFLFDSELMMTFQGDKYGASCYPAYQQACQRLAAAFESKSWEAFKSAYAELDQLKTDCHKAYK